MLWRKIVLAAVLVSSVFGGISCESDASKLQSFNSLIAKLAPPPPEPPMAAPAPPPQDAGPSELVAYFYKVLVQKEEPTMAQETILFGEKPQCRNTLLSLGLGKDSGPVILPYFRLHRDWFLPRGRGKTAPDKALPIDVLCLKCTRISAPFNFVGNVMGEECKSWSEHGRSWVVAWFPNDFSAEYATERCVTFRFEEGKINGDMILIGGFDAKPVFQELEEKQYKEFYRH